MTKVDEFIAKLLDGKALPPREASVDPVLARIERLDVTTFNETEVRAEIIEPLLKLLGYDIESWASLKRERAVRVVGASKALDYSMLLFQEDFWLVEAKRPDKGDSFNRDDVYQALRYAAHPEINAALMMLCDGNKLEIYDREVSLDEPLLTLPRSEWKECFDQLRALLSPWQVYFFERRRITRLVDKLFDQETHLERLEEFRRKLDQQLIGKRTRILNNWRERVDFDHDFESHRVRLETVDPVELIETDFFVQHNAASTSAMIANVATPRAGQGQLLSIRIFPETPRAISIPFWGHALHYLLELHKVGTERLLLPGWLGYGSVREAIERLIPALLTCFADDHDRKVVLLHSVATRRCLKLMLLINRTGRRTGEILHALDRYFTPEFSFAQSVSSPSRHLFSVVEGQNMAASAEFARQHTDKDRHTFHGAVAEQALRDIWRAERGLLDELPDYGALLRECKLDDLHWTESYLAWFDFLGHLSLCVLESYPEWKDWTIGNNHSEIVELARNGSWQARDWLQIDRDAPLEPLLDEWTADRFFLGDQNMATAIYSAYRR